MFNLDTILQCEENDFRYFLSQFNYKLEKPINIKYYKINLKIFLIKTDSKIPFRKKTVHFINVFLNFQNKMTGHIYFFAG